MASFNNKLPGYEIVSFILRDLAARVEPGIKTIDLNNHAADLIKKFGVKSAILGYYPKKVLKPYPAVTCICVNSEIAHGIPGEQVLGEGDIVSFDMGIIDSFGNAADAALTVPVGEITNVKKRLLYYAYNTTMIGAAECRVGANTETIARAISQYAIQRGYLVNRRFSGHTIGKEMHEKPAIYNTVEAKSPDFNPEYAVLKEAQIVCIEPMLTPGRDDKGVLDSSSSGWTFRTFDGAPSAFFEVMVKITKEGPKILTNHIDPPVM